MTALAAEDAAMRAGVLCRAVDAVLLDEDRFRGSRHYEVACQGGTGYLIVSQPGNDVAHDCLLLAASAEALRRRNPADDRRPVVCTLTPNVDARRRYSQIAQDAGLNCRVDGGALVGRSEGGFLVWEIGCRDAAGAWVEQAAGGPVVTDCLQVRALGGRCELTTTEEEMDALNQWFDHGSNASCRPSSARAMGRTAAGISYFEVACGSAEPVVVARDPQGRTVEVLTCAQAAATIEPCSGVRD